MPWQELSPMDLRMRFVTDWQSGMLDDDRALRGLPYQSKNRLQVDRSERHGPSGLHDRSRRPHHVPRATPPAVVAALMALRQRHPGGAPRNCWRSPPP